MNSTPNLDLTCHQCGKEILSHLSRRRFQNKSSSEKAYRQLISNENLKSSQKVIAVGRDACEGLLMGTSGEVKPANEDSKLICEELRLSNCEINKVLWSTSLAVFVYGSYSCIRF